MDTELDIEAGISILTFVDGKYGYRHSSQDAN